MAPKAYIRYDLDDCFDDEKHEIALKSVDLYLALDDFDQLLRQGTKYNDFSDSYFNAFGEVKISRQEKKDILALIFSELRDDLGKIKENRSINNLTLS